MRRVQRGCPQPVPPQDGFTLVETVVALAAFVLVVASSMPIFIGTLQSSRGLGAQQNAVTIAAQRAEYVRSIQAKDLVKGRNATDVAALIASPGLVNLSNDVTNTGNSDPAAATSASAAVPLTSPQVVGNVTYTVRTYINVCYLASPGGLCTATPTNAAPAYRVSIDVSWPRTPGVQCASGRVGQCEYVLVTLIDPNLDPVFSLTGNPAITSLQDGGSAPPGPFGPVHPGQQLTLRVNGSDFASGASVVADGGDVVGTVVSNTGAAITLPYRAGSSAGPRALSVVNPDGTTASTTFAVTISAPSLTSISPTSAPRAVARTFTLTGTDFFATPTLATQTTRPTVTMTVVILGITTPLVVSNINVLSTTGVSFQTTLPFSAIGYSTTATVTLTNPDGGTTNRQFTVTAT